MDSGPTPRDSPTAFAVSFLGIIPHQTQAEFLESRAPIRVLAAGRRWGKSTAAAIDLLWYAVTRPGSVQMVIAPTTDQARIIFDAARRLTEGGELAASMTRVVESPFPELVFSVRDASGAEVESVIMARSVGRDAKYLRGHGADRVIADEAAFIASRVLTDVIPPMLASSQYAELVLLSTPFGRNHFWDYFERGASGQDPNVVSHQYPSSANPGLSRQYLERQRLEVSDLAFQVEYLAQFSEDSASVFRSSVIENAIDEDLTADVLPGRRYVIGFDPARYQDRSGVVVLDVTALPWQVVSVQDISGRDYLTQASLIRELASEYNSACVVLDATSHDQMLEQLRRDGVRAEGYRFTSQSKQELIDGLVIALEQGDLRIPRHIDLLRELSYYRFVRTASGNVQLGAPDRSGHHDDLVTALALAVHAGRTARPVGPLGSRVAVSGPRRYPAGVAGDWRDDTGTRMKDRFW